MNHEKLLKNLIEIKSYSGEEEKIRNYIQNWFKERGIESVVQDGNLIVHFEGKDRSKAFIFNSHMDTVSAGDLEWKYGPWTPTKKEGKLYGLGSSDMKSGKTASMLLAEKISKTKKPPVDLWFTYVVKEEVDGSGTESFAKWFADNNYPKKYEEMAGIFTEPTSLQEIEHGHRGNIFFKATSTGDSGHASRPSKIEKHAVREMIKFADALHTSLNTIRQEFADNLFEPPTIGEMTSIQAGLKIKDNLIEVESPNKFPSQCIATFDLRTTPKFHEVAFEKIRGIGKKHGIKIEYAFNPAPAGFTNMNESIVKITKK